MGFRGSLLRIHREAEFTVVPRTASCHTACETAVTSVNTMGLYLKRFAYTCCLCLAHPFRDSAPSQVTQSAQQTHRIHKDSIIPVFVGGSLCLAKVIDRFRDLEHIRESLHL